MSNAEYVRPPERTQQIVVEATMTRYDFEKQDAVLRDQPLRVTRHLAVTRYLCPVCGQEFVKRSKALACAHNDGKVDA